MNPEADWQRVREEIIGGLWQANVDWASFTGQTNDATNYTQDAFIKAALQGEKFHIGIPVRLDGNHIPESIKVMQKGKDRVVILKMVDIALDNIQIQTLAPDAFKQYTGKGWQENGQEAYDCGSYPRTGSIAVYFSVNADKLTISVGSFYSNDNMIQSLQGIVGNFNPVLYEKYPSNFRPDGIGVTADRALSFTLGMAIDELDFFSLAHQHFQGVGGEDIKYISSGATHGYPDQENYLHPYLFIFSK